MKLTFIGENNTDISFDDSIIDDYLDGKLSKNSNTNEKYKTNLSKEAIMFGEDAFYVCALYVDGKNIRVLEPRQVNPIDIFSNMPSSLKQDFLTKIYHDYGINVFNNQLFGHSLEHVHFFDGMEECIDYFNKLIRSMKYELYQECYEKQKDFMNKLEQTLNTLSLYEEQYKNGK